MEPLQETYASLLDRAEERIGEAAFGPDADAAGPLYEDLGDTFEGLAACNLLLSLDLAQFRTDLLYSAAARGQFLAMCARAGVAPLHRARSRTNALFCAVAARDDALAASLVQLGPATWTPDGEYEDDFCYAAFVGTLAAPAEAAATLPPPTALLDRFAAVLDGLPTPRLAVCRAFEAGDESAFSVAFDDLLMAHQTWAAEAESARRDQPAFLATRHVFVEGLALLALAGRRGWAVPDEHAFCPAPARLGPMTAAVPDLFGEIARLAAASRRARGAAPTL